MNLHINIDEMGYLTLAEQHAANALYRVVDQRYHEAHDGHHEQGALAACGQVLHAGDLAGAIIDWILARGQLFELRGLSYRTTDRPTLLAAEIARCLVPILKRILYRYFWDRTSAVPTPKARNVRAFLFQPRARGATAPTGISLNYAARLPRVYCCRTQSHRLRCTSAKVY